MMSQRERRIQLRTCVVCRERRQREDLLRIVRTPGGRVQFDVSGRMNGRGAYVCGDAGHFGAELRGVSIDRGKLKHALKTEIDDSTAKLLGEEIISHIARQLNQ